jgi:hypothetical protein
MSNNNIWGAAPNPAGDRPGHGQELVPGPFTEKIKNKILFCGQPKRLPGNILTENFCGYPSQSGARGAQRQQFFGKISPAVKSFSFGCANSLERSDMRRVQGCVPSPITMSITEKIPFCGQPKRLPGNILTENLCDYPSKSGARNAQRQQFFGKISPAVKSFPFGCANSLERSDMRRVQGRVPGGGLGRGVPRKVIYAQRR